MNRKHTASGRISYKLLSPHVPFAPSRCPFFYGWIILFVGAAGVLMSAPGQTIGVSAFTDLLVRDLGVSQTNLSLAYLLGTLASSFALSPAGRAYDRYGARFMGPLVAAVLGGVLVGLSLIPEILGFLHAFIPGLRPIPTAFVLLSLGFFVLRFSGQGVLSLVSRNMVLKWFELRRGFANAIVGVATTILGRISGFVMGWSVAGSALGPYIFSLSLDLFGAYRLVSGLTVVVVAGLLLFSPFANRPEAP